jgi:hypothetical protein
MHDRLGLVIDKLDQHLDHGLKAARNTRTGADRSQTEQKNRQQARQERVKNGIVIDDRKIHDGLLMPGREVRQVMHDVL